MADSFEYDVFISFSSADEEIVKPIWQELCSNGLRVFWSDSTLKKEVGNSWFEVIENSLQRSRHMLLICSDNSINSKWVKREYQAFFDYCYSANSRRLIPLLTREFQPNNLPLFLRQLQVGKIDDPQNIQEIIMILGGVNIEKLQHELQSLREQVELLSLENYSLREISRVGAKKIKAPTQGNTLEKKESFNLSGIYTSVGIVLLFTGLVLFSILFKGWSHLSIGFAFRHLIFLLQFVFFTILVFAGLVFVVLGLPIRIKDTIQHRHL